MVTLDPEVQFEKRPPRPLRRLLIASMALVLSASGFLLASQAFPGHRAHPPAAAVPLMANGRIAFLAIPEPPPYGPG